MKFFVLFNRCGQSFWTKYDPEDQMLDSKSLTEIMHEILHKTLEIEHVIVPANIWIPFGGRKIQKPFQMIKIKKKKVLYLMSFHSKFILFLSLIYVQNKIFWKCLKYLIFPLRNILLILLWMIDMPLYNIF